MGRARRRTGTRVTSNMPRGAPSACTTRRCTSSPGTRSPRTTPTTRIRWPISGTISSARGRGRLRGVHQRTIPAQASAAVLGSNQPQPASATAASPVLSPAALGPAAADGLAQPPRDRHRRPCRSRSPGRHRWRSPGMTSRERAAGCPTGGSTPCWPPASSSGSRAATPTGCCASCSPPPSGRSCCGSRSLADAGVGSEDWWRRRVEAIAAHYPQVSWQLDAVRRLATGSIGGRRHPGSAGRAACAALGLGADRRRARCRIGRHDRVAVALGWPFEEKPLAYRPAGRPAGAAARRHGRRSSTRPAPRPWRRLGQTS